ncbi:alpha/beta hydrolase [Domibacillus sp. PGB-M46]|uniref:alpha/beta hydrolase n=1 Tax=Domibacillus sp. PGB-M46 TaxID=2910255 RepID=UPI001F59BF1C|nr:alpha/beta hydrolase [Domibacillus sp. PGB-M46]MCI2256049.1 alpha/beta hydrolase [Domibacillus sp. PGB-M46]
MQQDDKRKYLSTIDKTLITASLIDGFWDRWKAHGLKEAHVNSMRKSFLTKDIWMEGWSELAAQSISLAKETDCRQEAEHCFQLAGLHYQLMYWLIPERNEEKSVCLHKSLHAFFQADHLSQFKTKHVQLSIEREKYSGRLRIPHSPAGIVIIINPIDSAKEELFTYELDFLKHNFITVSFDGPGQGQTYTDYEIRGSTERWGRFIDALIDYTHAQFPRVPLYLFGTSSGASWAIYGSCNPKVTKAAAVSPAFLNQEIQMPEYFIERTEYILEMGEKNMLPSFDHLHFLNPVFLVHGKKDVMVAGQDIDNLYKKLPRSSCLKVYEQEGHCCNNSLPEIREIIADWLQKGADPHDV